MHDSQHRVQFYIDDRFLVRSLAGYVSNALAAGSSAILVVNQAHRDRLMEELARGGVDLAAVTGQGSLVAMDASDTLAQFMADGSLDEGLFREKMGRVIATATAAHRDQDSKIVIFGEMGTLLWERGDRTSAVRLEQLWNRLSEVHSFQLCCAYFLGCFDRQIHTEPFSRICGEHQVVIPAESYSDLPDENRRLRTVARLQQIEQVLKTKSVQCRLARVQKRQIENENLKLEGEIRKREAAEEELRRFTRRLLAARDEEQRRIAAELHENAAQLLAALSLYLGVLHEEKAFLNPKVASVVASSRSVSDNLLREIRKLCICCIPQPSTRSVSVRRLPNMSTNYAARLKPGLSWKLPKTSAASAANWRLLSSELSKRPLTVFGRLPEAGWPWCDYGVPRTHWRLRFRIITRERRQPRHLLALTPRSWEFTSVRSNAAARCNSPPT